MALRDPELMTAATAVTGVDALASLLPGAIPVTTAQRLPNPASTCTYCTYNCTCTPTNNYNKPQLHYQEQTPQWKTEEDEAARMLQHEVELAHLQQESERTRKLIAEVKRNDEEAAVVASATTARADAQAQ